MVRHRVVFTPEAVEHLGGLDARDRTRVLDAIERQLLHQPDVMTRNRKPLRENPLATWELRLGDLRVYYDARQGPDALVLVRAIGVKRRDRVFVGGEELKL